MNKERPDWQLFDSVRSINALIRLALAELRKEEEDDKQESFNW